MTSSSSYGRADSPGTATPYPRAAARARAGPTVPQPFPANGRNATPPELAQTQTWGAAGSVAFLGSSASLGASRCSLACNAASTPSRENGMALERADHGPELRLGRRIRPRRAGEARRRDEAGRPRQGASRDLLAPRGAHGCWPWWRRVSLGREIHERHEPLSEKIAPVALGTPTSRSCTASASHPSRDWRRSTRDSV